MSKHSFESPTLRIDLPGWVDRFVETQPPATTDESRMRLAIGLSAENVARGTGGPFGAAIFETKAEWPLAVGVNSVERLGISALHAEVAALMIAQAKTGRYSLRADDLPQYVLYTSCAPCAMCLGAALWGGVVRIVAGATREDAEAVGFDEGPVFSASYRYLEERGIEVVSGVLRNEARAVLNRYRSGGGLVYNG